jgi:Ni,Fe-hydrogenase III large subunit
MTLLECVTPNRWRDSCLSAEADGMTFEGLFAAPLGGELRLLAAFHAPGATRLLSVRAGGERVDTLVDAIPAAAWDERAIADLHGTHFEGHEPLRPLLNHEAPLDRWTVPVTGEDVHQVAVGPIHAGVIESGHFRFHAVGERILHLDTQLFFKRRGLERAAVGRLLGEGLAYSQRACAACAVTNAVAYAQACESSLGLVPDEHLRHARTILLELERVYNHLGDVSQICAGVGFAAGTMAFAALKERAQRLNAAVTGHRFLFGAVMLGRSDLELDASARGSRLAELRAIAVDVRTLWRELRFNRSFGDRLDQVGVLPRDTAVRMGAVGPAARASGVGSDQRSDSPLLAYADFKSAVLQPPTGDVASRLAQRQLELEQSFALLEELLALPLGPGRASAGGDAASDAVGIARVESPRGRTVVLVHHDGSILHSLHLRTGSYVNWPVLADTVAGALMPDFPLINKSFELCYACADR